MKKLTTTLLTLLACGAAYALPVGNPADPTLLRHGLCLRSQHQDPYAQPLSWNCAWSFRAGYCGDYVFNRHMEVSSGTMPDVDDFEIYTNAAYLAFNFSDRLDLFVTLGASQFSLETNQSTFLTPAATGTAGARFFLNTDTDFSWSVGGRFTFWQCGCTSLGLEGQYFSTSPNVNLIDRSGFSAVQNNIQGNYSEWQLGLGVAHQVGNLFVPYFAIKWSESDVSFGNAIPFGGPPALAFTTGDYTLFDLEGKKGWGYALGTTLIECERTSLTLEARSGDEKPFHLNAQFRI